MLSEVTFLIPVRIDSIFRKRNLISLLKFYLQFKELRFIVMEGDVQSKLCDEIFMNERIYYLFVKDNNPIFHRTKYINDMLRIVTTSFAAVWDADVIVPIGQILESLNYLKCHPIQIMSSPYDGCAWHINEFFSSKFSSTVNLALLSKYPQNRLLMNGYHSVGGAFIVSVENYRRVGWENEYFCGWGPEDQERFKRIEIMGYEVHRSCGGLFHLWHSRGVNSCFSDLELALSTKREFCKICAMNRMELEMYISSWPWIK